jgi:alpha-beta hydrolase superfamily lysophospholipase
MANFHYFSKMKTTDIYIKNKKGVNLAASLDEPDDGKVKAYAIYAHCFTCSKELKAIANIDTALAKYGIAVLRFDMTGIGSSGGDFTETNFTTQLEDFKAMIEYFEQNYKAPELFIGHSLGGCVALFSAIAYEKVKAVVTIASPAEPSNLSVTLKNTKQKCNIEGIAETEIGGVKYDFKPQFFEDIETYHLQQQLPNLKKPYLILHSPVDTYTDIKNAEILYQNASEPKEFIKLEGMDHLMLKKEDAFYAGDLIGKWSEKYM